MNNSGKQLEYYASLVEEKNVNIQVLQDELQLLQLELIKNDERVKALESENQQLVQRWLHKVNEAVDQLNAEVERSSSSLLRPHPLSATTSGEPAIPSNSGEPAIPSNSSEPAIPSNPLIQWSLAVEYDFCALVASPQHDLVVPLPSGLNGTVQVYRQSEVVQTLSSIGSDMRLAAGTFTRDADIFLGVPAHDKTVSCIWSLQSGRRLENLSGGMARPFVDIVPLASSNSAVVGLHVPDTLRLYDVPRSFCLWTENVSGNALAISSLATPQGSDLIATLLDDGRISLWDIRKRKVAYKSSHQSLPRILAIHSDPSRDVLLACSDRAIYQLELRNLRPVSTLKYSPGSTGGAIRPLLRIMSSEASPSSAFAFAHGHQAFVGDFSSRRLVPVGINPVSALVWITDAASSAPQLVVADTNRHVHALDPRSVLPIGNPAKKSK